MENETLSQEDFLAAFGAASTEDTTQEPENNENNNNEETTPNESADPGTADNTAKDGENTEGADDSQNNEDQVSKSAQAFAAMRVELSNKNKLLEGVATVLGLDPKQKDSMDQLQTKLNEALAKKQGVPVETLERLNRLEQLEQQRNIEAVRNSAFQGFQAVKVKFNLNDTELQDFANSLLADGKNPFVVPLDLVTEYKLKNFDRLLEQARNQGTQDEINRSAKANNNASTPNPKNGGGTNNEPEKITTVKQLNDWFNQKQGEK